jgi:hypothetical protein
MVIQLEGKAEKKALGLLLWLRPAVVYGIACIPMVPALMINVDVASGRGAAWTCFAVIAIIMGATFVEAARRGIERRRWGLALAFTVAAVLAIGNNVQNALVTAANGSDRLQSGRKGAVDNAKNRDWRLADLKRRRAEQAKTAGEKTPGQISAEIEEAKAKDARRWQATEECNPLQIKSGTSREFCKGLGDLKAQLEAANRRDDLDRQIDALNTKVEDAGAPSTKEDPYADSVVEFLGLSGIKADVKIVSASRDWYSSGYLEVMASLGPAAILFMFLPKARRREDKPVVPAEQPADSPVVALPPPIELKAVETPATMRENFFVSCTWSADGADVQSATMYKAYTRWCRERGADDLIMTPQAFGRHDDCPYRKERRGGTVYYFNCAVTEALIDKKPEPSARARPKAKPKLVVNNVA